jgi:fructosamine-3-kinase
MDSTDMTARMLLQRLHAVGIDDVLQVDPSAEGMAAVAGLATRRSGTRVFVKTFAAPPADDLFAQEAQGLQALRQLGGLVTPDVVHVARNLLVLSVLQPRPQTPAFWERVAQALARMHLTTVSERYGWAHDNWLGSSRQHNEWDDDGFRFFAESVCCAGWGSHDCRRSSTPANGEPLNGSASGYRRCCHLSRPA